MRPALLTPDHELLNGAERSLTSVQNVLEQVREAQRGWADVPLQQRLRCVRNLRDAIARNAKTLTECFSNELQRTPADSLTAEIIPLAEAARFLELNAARLLRTEKLSRRGRPFWLRNVHIELRREPLGVVLVIGPSNYPLFLPGVQALQALVAGNAVLLKPGREALKIILAFQQLAISAGIPPGVFVVLNERVESAQQALRTGVDKVVLTGSVTSGKAVLHDAAEQITPAIVELSGCDCAIVRADADVLRAAGAIAFGLRLNGGATCIAPRRIFVYRRVADQFQTALKQAVDSLPPVRLNPETAALAVRLMEDASSAGASLYYSGQSTTFERFCPVVVFDARSTMEIMRTDLFAPVVSVMLVSDDEEAVEAARACPYALGATIFGEEQAAKQLAGQVPAGVVVINDMIVPTADPRLSFGGMRYSGFGKTRGANGLWEMTHLKAVAVQRGKRLRHVEPAHPHAEELFMAFLAMSHRRRFVDRIKAWRAFGSVIRTN